jgi:hypothetical protein
VLQLAGSEVSVGDRMVQIQRHIDMLMFEQSRLAAELAGGDQWDREGYNSAYDWIRFNLRVKGNVASDYLSVGRHEPVLRQTLAAMFNDEIGFAHVATMADTAHAARHFDECALLPKAKEHSPGKFYRDCLHYRHSVDAEGYNTDQERLREDRYLHLTTTADGCLLLNGMLNPESGAVVRNALEPLARPSGDHDDRTPGKRWADALEERICGAEPAHLQVTATIETLKSLAGAAAGEMEFSLPIASESVQRIACDCAVTRVLLSEESMTIDVGRSKRVMSGALRKALRVRDGHCQWPRCERPASLCQGHHLLHWIEGGETTMGNMVLLCRRHHRMVHEGGWQMVRTDSGEIMTIAPTITFGLPRGPD